MKRKFKEYQIEGFDPGCIKDNDVVEIMEEYRKAYVKAREYAASKFQIGNFSFDTLEFDGDIDGYNEAKEQYLFDNGIEETKDYIKTKIGNVSWKHLRDYHAYDNGPCAGSVYEITVEIF